MGERRKGTQAGDRPSHAGVAAHIVSQIAGVKEIHCIPALQQVLGAAKAGELTVDPVGPAGKGTAVELVEVSDALDIGAVVERGGGELQVDALLTADALEKGEGALAFLPFYLGGREDPAVSGDEVDFVFLQVGQVVQHRGAGDGEGAGEGVGLLLR